MITRIRRAAVALLVLGLAGGAARGTLDGLVDALAARVPSGGVELALSVRAPSLSPRLAADVGELLAGRLRARGFRVRLDGEAGRGDQLIQLELAVGDGKLRASGTAWAVPSALWAPGGALEARAHLYAEIALDDEVRAYASAPVVAPTAPRDWQVQSVPLGDVALLALDVGDVDGDRRAEVVGATAGEVIVWRVEAGRAIERGRFPLSGRAAPLKPRADLVTISVENGAILAHASPFADGVRRAGATAQPLHGFAFPGVSGAAELIGGLDSFAGDGNALPERFWAAAGLRRPGAPLTAATVAPGELWVRAGSAPPFTARGAGAQVALASLERGELVATSAPVEPGEADAIVVRAVAAGLPVVHRLDRLPGNVRALAAGDVDGDGRVELVAALRDDAAKKTELWLVR